MTGSCGSAGLAGRGSGDTGTEAGLQGAEAGAGDNTESGDYIESGAVDNIESGELLQLVQGQGVPLLQGSELMPRSPEFLVV